MSWSNECVSKALYWSELLRPPILSVLRFPVLYNYSAFGERKTLEAKLGLLTELRVREMDELTVLFVGLNIFVGMKLAVARAIADPTVLLLS